MRQGHAPLIAAEMAGERPSGAGQRLRFSLFAAGALPANRLAMKISRLALGAYGIALAVVILDQLTKAWVLGAIDAAHISLIPDGYRIAEVAPPVFNLTYVLNTGVSFGLFGGGAGRWILSVFSVVVAGMLAWWATRADRRLLVAAIGLVMGGAIGNVIDRIRFGGVVDFLDFSGTGLFPWIFNVADSGITVGVGLLILDSFLSERRSTVGAAHEKS
ncbi:Lipoprotein signal peptidase [compost metagenome]